MKKGIIALSLLLASSATYAGDSNETCDQIHEIATSVMDARQRGVSVKKAMDIMGGTSIGKNMVMNAYEDTRWNSKSRQQDAVTEFANTYYLECVKAFSEE